MTSNTMVYYTIFTHTVFSSSFKRETVPPPLKQLSFKSFPHIVKRPLFFSVKNYFHLLILLFFAISAAILRQKSFPSKNNTPEVSICKCSMGLKRCSLKITSHPSRKWPRNPNHSQHASEAAILEYLT